MVEWFTNLDIVLQALIATLFTWGLTALGASLVFFMKEIDQKVLDGMLGFAAGVMIAASFWSLLAPAIDMAEGGPLPPWLVVAIGFLLGAFFLRIVDRYLPHLHIGEPIENAEGVKSHFQKSALLVLAITLHNIPEGLAVGVAFGAVTGNLGGATLASAIALAIGIGIQNFPEGAAVSMPLRREGLSRRKSFMYGQASGIVEPIAGVIGAIAVISMKAILPYALAFAAGAMIFVVVEELIPESQANNNTHIATMGAIVGFTVMMILDVALG
ncbi:MAG: ZIP family metal transporter [Firmicutes bacterium HGW-Firmicutes-7]|nr:MAG: ZIP family metal transporter [Firmicutes bacterium HGW-Firmicutes-7]